jgi:hypothetical protein
MKDKIDILKLLSKKELESEYFEIFGHLAPKGYTKSYLIKEIVWQEKYNKLSADLQNRINKLVNEYEKTKSVNIKKVRKFEVTNGTKFIREYKGEKYEVTAIENGFKYKEKTYKTLSAVANVITGTHWNGKKFFGVANG